VTGVALGDEANGWVNTRSSHAEYAVVQAASLARKPGGAPWEVAGALPVARFTAWAAVRAVALNAGDTLVVAGATGGVGSIAVQLARLRSGATVIGLASEPNHAWLSDHGVVPVAYGDGVAGRIRSAAPNVDAFIDSYGGDYVELALEELRVSPTRVDTITRFDAIDQVRRQGRGERRRSERRRAGRTRGPDRGRRAGDADRRDIPAGAGPRSVCLPRHRSPPRQDRPAPLTCQRRVQNVVP
jgi:NADPH:quinone reductase-like Zn-dependent oxidoreductase